MNANLREQLKEGNGIITMDYSEPAHYDNFIEMLGGKEALLNYPILTEIIKNTKAEHEKSGGTEYKSVRQLSDTKGQWVDGADIDYLYLDNQTNTLHGRVTVSLLQEQYCILTCITLLYKGESRTISNQEYNTSYQSFNFSFENFDTVIDFEAIEIIASVSQVSAKKMLTTQIIESKALVFIEPLTSLRTIQVNNPIHKATVAPNPITISYNRKSISGETIDYEYPEARVNNIQKLYIPFNGEVFLANNYSYVKYDSKSIMLQIDCKNGVAQYNGSIDNIIKASEQSNGFTWKFSDDWNTVIPSPMLPIKVPVSLNFRVTYVYEDPTGKRAPDTIFISSEAANPNSQPSFKQIPQLLLLWGCLGKDTAVLMEDKTEKKISEIKIGEKVITSKGEEAVVEDILEGYEENIICIKVEDGSSIYVTALHPFITKRGVVRAGNINGGDKLLMGTGEYLSPIEMYLLKYNDKVYNLVLKGDSNELQENIDMICNDFVVGDNVMQNKAEEAEKQKISIPDELKKEINMLVEQINKLEV